MIINLFVWEYNDFVIDFSIKNCIDVFEDLDVKC